MKTIVNRVDWHMVATLFVLAATAISVAFAESAAEGLSDLVIRQPISCTLVEAHFSRDITTMTEEELKREAKREADSETLKSSREEATSDVDAKYGIKTHSEINSVLTPVGGAAEGRSHFELNSSFDFHVRNRKAREYDVNERTIKNIEEKNKGKFITTGSDWKLRIDLQFRNNDDKSFVVNSNGYVWVEIDGMKIKVPISEEFRLTADGKSPHKQFVVSVLDEKVKKRLDAYETSGELQSKLQLVVDENLTYRDEESNKAITPKKEINPLSIYVDFGDAKSESPVKVRTFFTNGTAVTYGQALRAVNMELAKTVPNLFVFDDNGGLSKVLDRDFGKPTGNSIVLARVAGKVRYELRKEDLDKTPDRGGSKKELWFEELPIDSIANGLKVNNKEIRTICRNAIEEKKSKGEFLSSNEKYCAAMLNFMDGNTKAAYEYFALMNQDDYKKLALDQHDKGLIVMLAILESPVEYKREETKRLDRLIQALNVDITNKTEIGFVELAIQQGNVNAYEALRNCGFKMAKKDRTELAFASEKGKLEIVRWLLEDCPEVHRRVNDPDQQIEGSNKKSTGDAGKTPLYFAAKEGNIEVCKYLVSKGADVDRKFWEVDAIDGKEREQDEFRDYGFCDAVKEYLMAERECKCRCVRWRKPKVSSAELRKWFKAGVPWNRDFGNGWSLYSLAIDVGDVDLVFDMVNGGAPWLGTTPQGYAAWKLAVYKGNTNLIEVLCKSDQRNATALLRYALDTANSKDKSKFDICCYLLKRDADVNTKSGENGFTPLMWATKQNDTNMVAQLLQKGADANAVYKSTGKTALCYALESGYIDAIKLLLPQTMKRDLEIKGISHVKNFYQFAAMHLKDPGLLEQIFKDERSHDVDSQGRTPLMIAAYAGNMPAVEFLVSTKKESVDARDKTLLWGKGNTALDYAKKHKHQKVIDFLEGCLKSKGQNEIE